MTSETIGTILHGAYGDYYEQAVAWRAFKKDHPGTRLVLFFASESRLAELSVFDFSFADAVYPASHITKVEVDRYFQFQVLDQELKDEVLAHLPMSVLRRMDLKTNHKPWLHVAKVFKRRPHLCDIQLSPYGRACLPTCMHENTISEDFFAVGPTIGFLWRYRKPGGAVSSFRQPSEQVLLQTKSELLSRLASDHGARIIVGGMNVVTNDSNRVRTDNKFTNKGLTLPADSVTYLRGLSWGLELEIMRRCSLCFVMASGFSEALLMKRALPTVLLDPPLHYLAKLLWNRMPFFNVANPRQLAFLIRQPHTSDNVLPYLHSRDLIAACRSEAVIDGAPHARGLT